LAPTLGIGEKRAKNLVGPLRLVGLIDDQGKPTDRANDWRSDDHYADVCRQIRDDCYPADLRDAFPGPEIDRQAAEAWFSRFGKMGESSAKNVAMIFEVLTRADPKGQDGAAAPAGATARAATTTSLAEGRRATTRALRPISKNAEEPIVVPKADPSSALSAPPSLHVNIQIHISADASASQIDQIFSSMARHLGMGGNQTRDA
jgi:hypothetical protein